MRTSSKVQEAGEMAASSQKDVGGDLSAEPGGLSSNLSSAPNPRAV